MNSNKRLYKSEDPVFAGVCGGIAEFFDFDPTLVRILTVVLVLVGFGLPIIAYFVAMVLMPKRTAGYPDYIDVKPAATTAASATAATAAAASVATAAAAAAATANTASTAPAQKYGSANTTADAPSTAQAAAQAATQADRQGASSGAVPPPQPPQSAPGSGYTACNPQAYNCHTEQDATKQEHHGLHAGVKLGIVLVCIGVLALIGTFVSVSLWRFWPLILVIAGFVVLCTPGKKGWCLARAGNAISIITVGFVLQLWTLNLINTYVFFHAFFNLWPVLLIILGLMIIGGATEQSIFKLFGSLIFSLALLIGVWSFGFSGGPVTIYLPGERSIDITLPSSGFNPGEDNPPTLRSLND